jgi:site-specific DNA recombinase
MPAPKFFKTEFDALAINGAIGHPNGELAYGYLRVSSAGQAEEGRSGLPRQVMHVHETALKNRLRIPWECIFADDDSGFVFADREELSRLRNEYKSSRRKANAIVIEHLDRLSRNADWHQGYLLEEMKQFGMRAIFWKQFSSRIERAVMGAVAQDGMEQAKQRMAEGTVHKAKGGRVTAKVPAYGYKFVDSFGREDGDVKKDTHYAIKEAEAEAVRFIFSKVIEGYTLHSIGNMLMGLYPPPRKFAHWEFRLLKILIINPVYKGEFTARRSQQIKIKKSDQTFNLTETTGSTVMRKVIRPPEEWIVVSVPAIVSPADWELANKMLGKNFHDTTRTPNHPYLLTGLLWCATCKYSWGGGKKRYMKSLQKGGEKIETWKTWYRCSTNRSNFHAVGKAVHCDQLVIRAPILDQAVWSIVYQVLLHPEILVDALEREFNDEKNQQVHRQIAYLESQIREATLKDEKLYRAYLSDAFDEVEYAAMRRSIRETKSKLSEEINFLRDDMMTADQFEERKLEILLICQTATANGLAMNATFDVKKNVIHTVVDRITLNVKEGWFELDGIFRGRYLLPDHNDDLNQGPEGNIGEYGRNSRIVCNPKRLFERYLAVRKNSQAWVH